MGDLGEMSGKSLGDLGEISKKSWRNHEEIMGKSRGNLGEISSNFCSALHGQLAMYTGVPGPKEWSMHTRGILFEPKTVKSQIQEGIYSVKYDN